MEMRKMIKLLFVSFVCSVQQTAFAAVSYSDRKLILRLHNDFRSKVSPTASNMQKMYWDKKIASIAQRYANSCPRGHDTSEDRNVEGYNVYIGQNLAWGYANWKAALSAWHGEVTMYRYGVDPETYLGPDGWGKIGHYTQVVRDKAVRIGCGFSKCGGSSRTYVCNYALGNSYDLGRPYESGPSCSKCRGHCSNNLCDCGGKLCFNGGTLDLETCRCTCDELHKGDRCQKMNCPTSDAAHCGRAAPYGFPPSYCDRYTNVPVECPIMCGLCEGKGGSTGDSNNNGGGGGTVGGQPTESADCPAVDPWPCAEQWFPADCERYYNVPEECKIMCGTCPVKCPGKDFNYCKNGGTLDPNTCTCRCDSTWVGQRCENYAVCPKTQDDSHCQYWPASHCDKYYNVPEECPYMCGLCGKK